MSATAEQKPVASDHADPNVTAARLDELQSRTDGFVGAMESARMTSRIVLLAVIVFVVVAGWKFYSLGNMIRTPEYQNRLLAELQKSLASNQDVYASETQKLINGVSPIVQTAFAAQAQKDTPLIMKAIDSERAKMLENLQERMSAKIEKHHHDMLNKYEGLFTKEFPSLANAGVRTRMMANTCVAMDRLVQKFYLDEITREFKTMEKTWDDFPIAEAPTTNDPPLESQLVGELMDLLALKFAKNSALHEHLAE